MVTMKYSIIILLIALVAVPVLAEAPNDDTVTDSIVFTNNYADTETVAASNFYDSFKFNHFENVQTFGGIKGYTNNYSSLIGVAYWVQNKGVANFSSQAVDFIEHTTKYKFGSGVYGYSLGNNNDLYFYAIASSWDPSIYNGSVTVDIVGPGNTTSIRFTSGFICAYGTSRYVAPDTTLADGVYWYSQFDGLYKAASTREVDYLSEMGVRYIRTPGSPWDEFTFDRNATGEPTSSNITLSYYLGGSYQSAFSNTGKTPITYAIQVPNGTPQKLEITNPISGSYHKFEWDGQTCPANMEGLTIEVYDGSSWTALGGSTISVLNVTTHANNISYLAPNGTFGHNYPVAQTLDIGASKTGYDSENITWVTSSYCGSVVSLILYPYSATLGNGTANFIIENMAGDPIQGATIKNVDTGELKYTNNLGFAYFSVNKTTAYDYTIEKSGYTGAQRTVNLGGSDSVTTYIRLVAGTVPTATLTTLGPLEDPHPSPEKAATDVIQLIADFAYAIAAIFIIGIVLGGMKLWTK
jgi:hypothetical protein